MGKFIHGSQVLLEEAEKAFSVGNQERGISFIKDCVEMLTNGLKNLQAATAEQPAEQPGGPEEPGADEAIEAEQAAEQQAAERPANDPMQPAESESKPGPQAPSSQIAPCGRTGAGIVSGPNKQESKPNAGVVSEPEKSQNGDGSGVS